jgi:site-specific recombinase XerD
MNLKDAVRAYLQHLQTLGRSPYTVKNTRSMLRSLVAFLEEQKIDIIEDLQADVLEEYQQDLAFRITAKGRMLSLRTQGLALGVVKSSPDTSKKKTISFTIRECGSNSPRNPNDCPR